MSGSVNEGHSGRSVAVMIPTCCLCRFISSSPRGPSWSVAQRMPSQPPRCQQAERPIPLAGPLLGAMGTLPVRKHEKIVHGTDTTLELRVGGEPTVAFTQMIGPLDIKTRTPAPNYYASRVAENTSRAAGLKPKSRSHDDLEGSTND